MGAEFMKGNGARKTKPLFSLLDSGNCSINSFSGSHTRQENGEAMGGGISVLP